MLFCSLSSKPKLSSGVCCCLHVAGDSTFRTEGPSSPWPKAEKALTEAEEEGTSRADFLSLSPFWGVCVCVCVCMWCFVEHLPKVPVQLWRCCVAQKDSYMMDICTTQRAGAGKGLLWSYQITYDYTVEVTNSLSGTLSDLLP